MHKGKVAFLFARTPSKRDIDRFRITEIAQYQDVVLFDFSPVRERSNYVQEPSSGIAGLRLEPVSRVSDLVRFLSSESPPTVAVDFLPPGRIQTSARQLLRTTRTALVGFIPGSIPRLKPAPTLTKIAERRPTSLKGSAGFLIELWRKQGARPEALDYYITSGDKSKERPDARTALQLIEGRSLDCEDFDQSMSLNHQVPFAVLVDSGGPLHPDYKQLSVRPPLTPNQYFDRLRRFVSLIHETTAIDVLLAPHPRLSTLLYRHWMPDVNLIPSSTSSAVKSSEFVVDVGSTATSFSVLAGKPVSYLSLGQATGSIEERLFQAFAKELERPILRFDAEVDESLLRKPPDLERYDSYRKNYLFSDSSSNLTFAEHILSLP